MPGRNRQARGGMAASPEVGVAGVGMRLRAVVREMRRVRKCKAVAASPEDCGKAVHALRVCCRRAGAALLVCSEFIEERDADRAMQVLRRLRREAGSVRNADVHTALLGELRVAWKDKAGAIDTVLVSIAKERRAAWTQLRERVGSHDREEVRRLRRVLDAGLKDVEVGSAVLAAAREQVAALVEQARLLVVESRSDSQQLHRLRIVLKRIRYTMELLFSRDVLGAESPAALRWIVEAQRRLGEVNDAATLAARLHRLQQSIHKSAPDIAMLRERFQALEARRLSNTTEWLGADDVNARLDQLLAASRGELGKGSISQEHVQPDEPVLSAPTRSSSPDQPPTQEPAQQNLFLAGQRLAVIDVGSNGIRLLAVELNDERSWNVLAEERATARLAEGQGKRRELCPQAMARAVEAIHRFKARCDSLGCVAGAFATAAVRDAVNRADFISLVKDRTGLDLVTISALDEGRYTFGAVARRYDLSHGTCAVVDIGGGSLEVVLSQRGVVVQNSSMPLGAVRLTEAFGGAEGAGRNRFADLKRHIDRTLARGVKRPRGVPGLVVGCGGTFTTMLTVGAAMRGVLIHRNSPALRSLGPVSRAQLREIIDHLRSMSLADRLRVPGLPPDRADIVVAGLVVVERLMKHLGVSHIHANPGGVREGLLTRMVRERAEDMSERASRDDRLVASARRFAEGCLYERDHSEHVAALAVLLYDECVRQAGLVPRLGTVPHERAVLEAAGLLHDVGIMVEYRRHHKHSATIVRHADLPGWDARLQEVLAQLCRYHRRGAPGVRHRAFASLNGADRALVRRLSGLLRVADGLDRSHAGVVHDVRIRTKGDRLVIDAVTAGDADAELRAARVKSDVLGEAAGRRLNIQRAAPSPQASLSDRGEVVVRRQGAGVNGSTPRV